MAALAPLRFLFGQQIQSEPLFETIVDERHVQIRKYHTYHLAKLRVQSDEGDQNRRTAYMRLLAYLLGKNSRKQKLKPMAPLFQEDVSARMSSLLELASVDKNSLRAFEVSVVLPIELNSETAPIPDDSEIQIQKMRPHLTAVIQFSGLCGSKKRERLAKYLSLWFHAHGYTSASAPRIARYNPTFTLPFLRRNEIHIDVIRK